GRSGQRRAELLRQSTPASPTPASPAPPAHVPSAAVSSSPAPLSPAPVAERVVDGLLIPRAFSYAPLLASRRSELFARLLHQPGAEPAALGDVLDDIGRLLAGPITDDDGNEARAMPGEGADLEIWILGSSGGESARVAGERGLPFAANYHVAPAR